MKKILLIDDDALVLKSTSALLRKKGYEVIGCKSGFEAITAFKSSPVDLIISDIRMAGQDGIQTVKKIRELESAKDTGSVPVIMITGFAEPQTPVEAIKVGVQDYLFKPFDNSALIESIEKQLNRPITEGHKKSEFYVKGIGIISPFGFSKEALWDYINNCIPLRQKIADSSFPELNGYYCAKVKDFLASKYFDEKQLHNIDDNSAILVVAAKLAIEDAGINVYKIGSDEIGVSVGTAVSIATSMSDFEESVLRDGNRRSRIGIFPNTVICAPASRIAIFEHITGSNTTISSGMNSGIDAIGQACYCLESGIAKVMLAGGSDALSDKVLLGYVNEGLLVKQETESFKNKRGTFLPSDGACILVLGKVDLNRPESNVYCTISSYASCFSPFKKRDVAKRSSILAETLKDCLNDAELRATDLDCILMSSYFDEFDYEVERSAVDQLFKRKEKHQPLLASKKILGESFAAFAPQMVAIGMGLFLKKIKPEAIRYLNENEQFSQDEKIVKNILIVHVDSSGHNSAMILKSNTRGGD